MLRIILAALAGYIAIGILIAGTDQLYAALIPGFHASPVPPLNYFLFAMVTDTIYTYIGGWVCGVISRRDLQATLGLIILGEVMGVASTVYLWETAPHFYSFYLLIMYPLAVWYGAKLRAPVGT